MATEAEKQAHGRRLVLAMARKPISNQALADALSVDPKTVGNWRNGRTMPSADQLVRLGQILGPYNLEGDPVELAVRQSALHEWRQDAVLSTYKKHLHEQRAEQAG